MLILSLGSNIGDRLKYISDAVAMLSGVFGKPIKISSVYETEPYGVLGHDNYLNLIVCFQTDMLPEKIFKKIHSTEKKLGRIRQNSKHPEPRTIDIDVLFYGEKIIQTPNIEIPHPRIALRKFVLIPLAEIMNDFIHPVLQKSILILLSECPDKSAVVKTHNQIL